MNCAESITVASVAEKERRILQIAAEDA